MRRVKQRIFSGAVCEQIVYSVPDRTRNIKESKPRPRFANDQERAEHRMAIARRRYIRMVNANFCPTSLYSTLTFDDEHEAHTFPEAKRIMDAYVRRLRRACPDARFTIVKGRGKSTQRIHFHMISEGIPRQIIREKWGLGEVTRIVHLRKNCVYNGVDHGQDYTGLATYLFNHWTEEQGGHYYFATRNMNHPEAEEPKEALVLYSEDRPPRAPKGYVLVAATATKYGCLHFTYVAERFLKKKPPGAGWETGE